MAEPTFSACDIARFLQENPGFFTEHATVFASLAVPHPHQAHTISLAERQILALRERVRELEWQLSGLLHHASGNERLAQLLAGWCAGLLAEDDAQLLPEHIALGLARQFSLPDTRLLLWDLPRLSPSHPYGQAVDESLRAHTEALERPYCGPASGQAAASLLDNTPESLALVPLHTGQPARCVGLLILGSTDDERFTTGMATDLLQILATLAGSALARLDETPPDNDRA